MLKRMVEHQAELDRAFHALSDPTRRAIYARLAEGPLSVSALAEPFASSLAAIVQHVQVLERAGLIATRKSGRTRLCALAPDAAARAERWLSERRSTWEARFDRLGALVEAQQRKGEEE